MKISVVGLGKLGSPLAAVLASKGHEVIGVDVNEQNVAALNALAAPIFEPGLAELLSQCRGRIRATTDCREAVLLTDVTFIVVATPSDPTGGFSLRFVEPAVRIIGQTLADKDAFHVVVVTSTVMPGATENDILPALEARSGKVCGRDFGLCYNPEFIALGSVIRDMFNPDFILIGESDRRAGDVLEGVYRSLFHNQPPVKRMNFVNAEVAKLAVNTFVTTKISYANMLARVCERMEGADADVVTSAIGLDSRIGSKYLKGAVSYGGPCFPRDNQAFAALAARLGARATLAEITDQFNRQQTDYLTELALSRLPSGGFVGVLGLAYKPGTDVVDESVGVNLANQLSRRGATVVAFDPQAVASARRKLDPTVRLATCTADCVRQADVLIITVAWDEFRGLSVADLRRVHRRPVIIDCWRMLNPHQYAEVADWIALGKSNDRLGQTASFGSRAA